MKPKPRGYRYRNLVARGNSIYVERVVNGKRFRVSAKTNDWAEAAAFRDAWEERKGLARLGTALRVEAPRFRDFAKRQLEEDTSHLAPTTRAERERELGAEGAIVSYFGDLALDEITPARLRGWWSAEIVAKGRTTKTGRNVLDAISAVFGFAVELELLEASPVDAFRTVLRRKGRTQRGRAEADAGRHIRPIDDAGELRRLVAASRDEGIAAHVLVLLCLDAGLRWGEAIGLRWGHVLWGESADDPRRALQIEESRPRSGEAGPTKSGRARRVQLSRRLVAALQELYRASWAPKLEANVLPTWNPSVFRRSE